MYIVRVHNTYISYLSSPPLFSLLLCSTHYYSMASWLTKVMTVLHFVICVFTVCYKMLRFSSRENEIENEICDYIYIWTSRGETYSHAPMPNPDSHFLFVLFMFTHRKSSSSSSSYRCLPALLLAYCCWCACAAALLCTM